MPKEAAPERRFCGLFGLLLAALGLLLPACQPSPSVKPPIPFGLMAPLSAGSAASGQAILRGMLLAIDDVNRKGGVLGRHLAVIPGDTQNDPQAAVAALREMLREHGVVAVFGGIYSPVMLQQLNTIHELQLPLINPWGSMTAITRNGRDPNYAFRVSASDEYADEFLARYAVAVAQVRRPGIIADSTAWGMANAAGLQQWFGALRVRPAGVEHFDQGDTDMSPQLGRLHAAGADAILMVANAPEGAAIIRGQAALGRRVPVISHWGISGGRFVELAGVEYAEGVLTLQTFTFFGPLSPRGEAVLRAYHRRFGTRQVDEILAPVGVAHSYDGVQLLAGAIRQAGSTEGDRVRQALERLQPYDGVIKRYDPAFTPARHDALVAEDYLMGVWQNGRLVPAAEPRMRR